jgi:hypothetical protein
MLAGNGSTHLEGARLQVALIYFNAAHSAEGKVAFSTS